MPALPAHPRQSQIVRPDGPSFVAGEIEAACANYGVIDAASPFKDRRIGRILVATGALTPNDHAHGLRRHDQDTSKPLGTVLVQEGLLAEDDLGVGLALQAGVLRVRPLSERIDLSLVDEIGADFCLRHGLLPWRRTRDLTVIATSRPHRFGEVAAALEAVFGPVRMAVAFDDDLSGLILELRSDWLISTAEAAKSTQSPAAPQTVTVSDPMFGHGLADSGSPFRARPLGEILVETGALVPANLDRALELQNRTVGLQLGRILIEQHLVSEDVLASGLALQKGVLRVQPNPEHVDAALVDLLGADFCLRHSVVPWRRAGGFTVVATSRPQCFQDVRPTLEKTLGRVRMAVAYESDLTCALLELRASWLTGRAEARPPVGMSVRRWGHVPIAAIGLGLILAPGLVLVLAPRATLTALTSWAVLVLVASMLLRTAALVARLTEPRRTPFNQPEPDVTPVVSVLVPLLSEAEISAHLIDRLSDLEYRAGKLEICLVCEEDDHATEAALENRGLGPQFRIIVVPKGMIRTKPRALNYALDFCRGDIVGIYDAEDAPAPDQIRRVAARFAAAPSDVVCLQGQLAFYNAPQNWLSRCFAIDYASWFRIILPGLARLNFAIPLGGTSVFFRRSALEAAGRWDAHNVTEDADLGIRLARLGWRTEILNSTTREEANCRPAAWIRQRGRWLKGYALTWAVHMAEPRQLLRDLGPKRFLGFQILFFGTLSAFLLAPLLWSFWLLAFGVAHPVTAPWASGLVWSLIAIFVLSEFVNIAISTVAVASDEDRWLVKWVPSMILYYPLATVAAFRALIDAIRRPYFWDKTNHGISLRRFTGSSRQNSRHSAAGGSQKR
ncbi:MAG: glycosyltransferase [Pseudomonadota bacterium]